jgi:hypothetical protein
MSYSKFTLSKVKADFAVITHEADDIFAAIAPIPPSAYPMLGRFCGN